MNEEFLTVEERLARASLHPEPAMTEDESLQWRPQIRGWSSDIHPFYRSIAAELPKPCRVAEIGVASGRSAIFLAQELRRHGHDHTSRIYCVDSWGGSEITRLRELLRDATDLELDLLYPIRAESSRAADLFVEDSLDMVFVDADHSFEGCASDLCSWWPTLRVGGIFAGHDYSGADFPGVVKAVNEFAKAYDRKLSLPTRSVWRLK